MGSEINSSQRKEREKKEKKTTELRIHGGARCEIGKLIVLGGALAAAALIAALTNKTRKRRPSNTPNRTQKSVQDPPKPSKKSGYCSCAGGGNEGLRSLLQTPSQSMQCQHSCCCFCDEELSRIGSTHIKVSKLVVVQSLILEANNSSKETDKGNIPALEFDDYNINKAENPISTIEATPLLNYGTCSLKQEIIEKDDDVGGSPTVVESPSLKSYSEEEEDESFKEEEGSEVTSDSSVESSAEAVWPAESIEAELLDLEETEIYSVESDSAEKNEKGAKKASRAKEDEIIGTTMEVLDPKDDTEFNMVDDPSLSASSRSSFLLRLMMLVVLLILLLAITSLDLPISSYLISFMT